MAKTIKFNLVCDGHQVRTLEDLRNNFCIEDILQYYKDGMLEKWLRVRGYLTELDAMKKIRSDLSQDIIREIIPILGLNISHEAIECAVSTIKYKENRILAEEQYMKQKHASDALYARYFKHYESLINDILENPRDKAKIQAIIKEIVEEYAWIFKCDYRNFYYKIKDVSPLAVLCLMMNPYTRKFYIIDDDGQKDDSSILNKDIKEMYDQIKYYFSNDYNIVNLGDVVVKKNNETGYRFVSLTSKKCLVIGISKAAIGDCSISSYHNNEDFLIPVNVNGKFLIMDGLQYQSQNKYTTLYYIEI